MRKEPCTVRAGRPPAVAARIGPVLMLSASALAQTIQLAANPVPP